MTRMWIVNPKILCDNHLLGEHKELHQLVGHIKAGNINVVKGHADRQQIDTSLITDRHEELVLEMIERGMNHHSPLDYVDKLNLGTVDVSYNIDDLCDRCEKCNANWEKLNR